MGWNAAGSSNHLAGLPSTCPRAPVSCMTLPRRGVAVTLASRYGQSYSVSLPATPQPPRPSLYDTWPALYDTYSLKIRDSALKRIIQYLTTCIRELTLTDCEIQYRIFYLVVDFNSPCTTLFMYEIQHRNEFYRILFLWVVSGLENYVANHSILFWVIVKNHLNLTDMLHGSLSSTVVNSFK